MDGIGDGVCCRLFPKRSVTRWNTIWLHTAGLQCVFSFY